MVRVIIEHKAKEPKDAERLIDVIRELRNEAMRQPGYITGETLVNTEDIANVLVISTWQNAEDWKAWDISETRVEITKRINQLLAEPYTVRIYRYSLVRQNRVWTTF